MWLVNFWRFMRSYLKVKIEGVYTERLVNLAVIRGIGFWNLRKSKNEATLELPAKNLEKLRPLASQTGCRITILHKQGILVWWKKGKKRKAFVLGGLLFLFSLYAASSFVWFVQATGTEKLSEKEVLEIAEEAGLKAGMYKGDLEVDKIESRIARLHEDIVWAGVRIRGTTVEVEIVEHKREEERPPEGVKADLVAAKDGLVQEVLVLSGEEEVEPGEEVKRGDVLIKGVKTVQIPEDPEEEEVLKERTFPRGKVRTRVHYEAREVVQSEETIRKLTGRQTGTIYLSWNGTTRRLWGPSESPYEECRKELERNRWKWGSWRFPVEIISVTYEEARKEVRELSSQEALDLAKRKSRRRAMSKLPEEEVEIKNYYWDKEGVNGERKIRFVVETIEDIAEIRYYNGNNSGFRGGDN